MLTSVRCVVGSSDDVVPLQDVGRVWESFDVGHGLLEQLLQLLLQPLMIDAVPSSDCVINWTAQFHFMCPRRHAVEKLSVNERTTTYCFFDILWPLVNGKSRQSKRRINWRKT